MIWFRNSLKSIHSTKTGARNHTRAVIVPSVQYTSMAQLHPVLLCTQQCVVSVHTNKKKMGVLVDIVTSVSYNSMIQLANLVLPSIQQSAICPQTIYIYIYIYVYIYYIYIYTCKSYKCGSFGFPPSWQKWNF